MGTYIQMVQIKETPLLFIADNRDKGEEVHVSEFILLVLL